MAGSQNDVEKPKLRTIVYVTMCRVLCHVWRCRAYIFPIVKTVPIDVSAHARI